MDGGVKGDPLPPVDHVLRHCLQRQLKTEADGTIRGVFPDAFDPDEDGVSVTWMEYFQGASIADQIAAARAAMYRGMRPRAGNRLAKLNVGAVLSEGQALGTSLSIIHDPIEDPPERANHGHSLLVGVTHGDEDLKNRLANLIREVDLFLSKV